MTDKKIVDLNAATSVVDTDLSVVETNPGTTPETKKITIANLKTSLFDLAATIHAASSKNPPADADEIPIADSATSFTLKKLTWVNLKSTLKTYFDAFYGAGTLTGTGTNGKITKWTGATSLGDATNTDTDVADAVTKRHTQQHAITSTGDHTSTATSGQMLKANANGLPVDATNTDAQVASAVSLKHTQGTDTALGTLGTKNPPVDADLVVQRDSANSFALFTSTWTQIKAFLKTYFDTIYTAAGGAPASAQYVTLALDATLSAERVLTAGEGITIVDGGANGNVTLSQTRASAGIDTDANVFSAHHSLGGGGNQASPGDHVHPSGNAALTLSTNGAWSWFTDPRAVYFNNQTYFGYIDNAGNVKIRSFNHISQTLSAEVTLHATLETDDHDNPSILIRNSDKRIIVFYSKHNGTDKVIYERISTNPEDISSFAVETTIDPAGGTAHYTYSNPIQLTGEANSPIYLFYRRADTSDNNTRVAYTKSTDGGVTWGSQVLVAVVTYAKIAQNGVDRIDFAVSNHPADAVDHGIYHFYYKGGSYYKSDGTVISASLPFAESDMTQVYDGSTTIGWIWDCAIDVEGNPTIVYATFPGGVTDHRYNYAKWVNGAWSTNQIVAEGDGTIYASPGTQDYYSGGVVLDHQDPTTTYLSKYVSSRFEIWKYQTPDNGATWTGLAITSGSSDKNIRPVAVRNHASDLKFLWLEGTYTTYISYTLNVKGYGSGTTSFAPSANTPQDVGSADTVGTGTNPPHDDHVHKGVHSLAHSGDAALYGDVTLTGTGGVAVSESGQNISIDGSGVSGGDHLHGLTRWAADGGTTFELPDIAEYLELVADNGSIADETTLGLSSNRTQLIFGSAPTAGHILQAEYVLARL